ncbi:hypothetical protein [Streptomyces lanatus]|uniref:Uncharacterized protein n=1 Tax=Streptomyces lanatus TaxID=66900 RepID=A0ABV1Y0R8_9ACTN|nr:hypothetical protein [Streptomyces lanatus]GHH23270.1 hypothetical protein GCM10018780_72500 [Streptomyces lanatus]
MKIIAAAALAGAALLAAAIPAAADDGPLDFGVFQGVNDTHGSTSTNGSDGTVPRSVVGKLLEDLVTPGRL